MSRPEGPQRLARRVHRTLFGGVTASGLLLAFGLSVSLWRGQVAPDAPPPPIGELLARAGQGNGPSLTYLGLMVLMITPLLRVAVLAVGWAKSGEWRFAGVAAGVLGLLGLGLALGLG